MEDIYKLIDDINLQKLDHLDTRVNEALTSNNDDALFIGNCTCAYCCMGYEMVYKKCRAEFFHFRITSL